MLVRRIWGLLIAIMLMFGATQGARAADDVTYKIKRGDTLIELAHSYMVRDDAWREVARINGVSNPNLIQPERSIRIPIKLLKFQPVEARLSTWRGNVSVAGAAPQQGMKLQEGARIVTSGTSFATVQMGDGSRVTIPSQSSVVFGRLRKILLTGTYDIDVIVEKGRAETNVAKKSNSGDRYQMRSPIAVSAVRGTVFRIAYLDDGSSSLTEVVEGTVAVSPSGKTASRKDVVAGFGAGVTRNGAIATEKLLAAPEPIMPGRRQKEPLAEFSATSVPGASAYRLQVAEDAGFVSIISEQSSDKPQLAVADLPNGTLFARIAAIAPSGMTGEDKAFSFDRHLASISGSAEGDQPGKYLFRWKGQGEGVRIYQFRLWREGESVPMVDEAGLSSDSLVVTDLAPGAYFWRIGLVQMENGIAVENWTAPERLIVPVPEG